MSGRNRTRQVVGRSNGNHGANCSNHRSLSRRQSENGASSQATLNSNARLDSGFDHVKFIEDKLMENPFAKSKMKPTSILYFTEQKVIDNQKDAPKNPKREGMKLDLSKIRAQRDKWTSFHPRVESSRFHRELGSEPIKETINSARLLSEVKTKTKVPTLGKGKQPDRMRHGRIEWDTPDPSWAIGSRQRFTTHAHWNLHEHVDTRPNAPWNSRIHHSRVRSIKERTNQIDQYASSCSSKYNNTLENRIQSKRRQQQDYEHRNRNIFAPVALRSKRAVPGPAAIAPRTSVFQASP